MIAGTASRFAGERPWKRSGKCLILCANSIGLARLPIGHKALITVGVAMAGANAYRRPPDELRLQACHGLSSRITSLYWFNLSLRSLLAFPDLIEPMTRVGREIRMLEDYYLEGDAVSHERILRDGKPDWNLDVIAGPRDAVLFALDLDYEPDGKERVFKFGAPRESNFRFRIPVYLNSIDEVFRVDADGLRDVEATLNEGTITIRDQASRVAIYVASEKPTERARIEARRQALMTDENALDFDPAHQEADLQVLRQHKNCLPIEHPICSDPIIPNDSKFGGFNLPAHKRSAETR